MTLNEKQGQSNNNVNSDIWYEMSKRHIFFDKQSICLIRPFFWYSKYGLVLKSWKTPWFCFQFSHDSSCIIQQIFRKYLSDCPSDISDTYHINIAVRVANSSPDHFFKQGQPGESYPLLLFVVVFFCFVDHDDPIIINWPQRKKIWLKTLQKCGKSRIMSQQWVKNQVI